jgi:hypothetical protein
VVFPQNAPKNREITGITRNDERIRIHFASDLSGEEQPPFRGWFTAVPATGKVLFYRQLEKDEVEFWD